jgi:hypothetical protein
MSSKTFEYRFTKYRLNQGQPFRSYTYTSYAISLRPKLYFTCQEDSPNYGLLGDIPSPTAITWAANATDGELSILGLQHPIVDLLGDANSWGVYPDAYSIDKKRLTISLWFQTDNDGVSRSTDTEVVFNIGHNTNTQFRVTVTGNDTLNVIYGGTTIYTQAGLIETGETYGLTFVYDDTDWYLYLNGLQIADGTGLALVTATTNGFIAFGTVVNTSANQLLPASHIRLSGHIEGVGIYEHVMDSAMVLRLAKLGLSGSYYSPYTDLDTVPLLTRNTEKDFSDFVTTLAPVHWYRLHETSGTTADDVGAQNVDGTYTGSTVTVTGPLEPSNGTSRGRALYGDAGLKMVSNSRLFPHITLGNQTNGFSISFYTAQGANFSRNNDVLFSWVSRSGSSSWGMFAYIKRGAITFEIWNQFGLAGSITVPSVHLPDVAGASSVTRNTWALYTFTLSPSGVLRAHVNDTLDVTAPVTCPGATGIRVGNDVFTLGHIGPVYDTNPEHFYSEVMMFDKTLTTDQVRELYYTGKFGKSYGRYVIADGASSTDIVGYEVSSDPVPSLVDPVDITEFCGETFNIERAIDQLVSTGSIDIVDNASNRIETVVKPNDVIVIERRTDTLERNDSSGWQTVATMLVEGTTTDSVDASGNTNKTMTLKSFGKVLGFDLGVSIDIEPDRFTLKKVPAELVTTAPDAYEFQVPRPESPGEYFYNFAPTPTPRLRISNLRNLVKYGTDPVENFAANDLPPEIVVKSAENSIQFAGNRGIIRIDRDYYEDTLWPGVGLGDPDPDGGLRVDADRYCTPEDELRTFIIGVGVISDQWAVQIDNPLKKRVGRTMFITSGSCRQSVYKLFPLYPEQQVLSWMSFETAGETGSNVVWGDITNPGGSAFANDGEPDKVLTIDNLSAYTAEGVASGFTNYLTVTSPKDVPSLEYNVIRGVEVRVRRWAYVEQNAGQWRFTKWANNSGVNDNEIRLTMNGVAVGDNKAITSKTVSALDYSTSIVMEEVVYGGDNDLWGLASLAPHELPSLGVRLRAAFGGAATNFRAGVESIEIRFYVEPIEGSEQWHIITDYNGSPINPEYDNLDIGTEVLVGNANRVERVLMLLGLIAGFQVQDSSRPLYLNIQDLPSEYNIIVPPVRAEWQDRMSIMDLMTEIRQFALPNYLSLPTRTGGILFKEFIQADSPSKILEHVQEVAGDSSDLNIYTRTVTEGEGGDSVNLGIDAAVRAVKLNNWAVEGSTNTGTGINSTEGFTYAPTDSNYATMNARLSQVFDNSQRTPILVSGGWNDVNSIGVLWAKSGKDCFPYAMEDETLFMADLGRNVASGREFLIEAIEVTAWNTFGLEVETIPQQMSIDYMTEEDYAKVMGTLPPPTPDQTWADLADSYFPPADSWAWQPLIDQSRVNLNEQTTWESTDFEPARSTKFRFVRVRIHQASYYDGKGVASDRGSRISISDMKFWTSRKIIATATLGSTPPYNLGSHKEAFGRLWLRTYIYEQNPIVENYDQALAFAEKNLVEQVQDFLPRSITTTDVEIEPGQTVQYRDFRTNEVVVMLVRVQNDRPTSTFLLGVDYRLNSEALS